MQAHPQRTLAARTFSSSILIDSPVSPTSSFPRRPAAPSDTAAAAGLPPTAGHPPSPINDSVAEGAGLAHDAGNLLQALGLYCDLLQGHGVLRPEHKHYATELRHLADRSSAMILRLLKGFEAPDGPQPDSLARLRSTAPSTAKSTAASTTRFQLRSQPQAAPATSSGAVTACLHPSRALHAQAPLLQRLAAPWAMLSIMTQDGLPGLEFSAEILERITVNLVLNAAEALRSATDGANPRHSLHELAKPSAELALAHESEPAGQPAESKSGRIRVSLRMVEGRLRLSVEDNGPGVPPPLAAAFLRPSPLPPGAARGLGHRIVHELATATGGQLSIQTRPGAGTTFSLDWPVKMATLTPQPDGPSLRLVSSHSSCAVGPLSSVRAAAAANSARSQAVAGGFEAC